MRWRGGYGWIRENFFEGYYSDGVDKSMGVLAFLGLTVFWAVVGFVAVVILFTAFVNGLWLFYHPHTPFI